MPLAPWATPSRFFETVKNDHETIHDEMIFAMLQNNMGTVLWALWPNKTLFEIDRVHNPWRKSH